MFNFLALLSGIVIAVMVVFNGDLTAVYSNYNAAFIIHVVGVIFAFIFQARGRNSSPAKTPLWFYSAGALHLHHLQQLLIQHKISLTSILALTLFGQTAFSYSSTTLAFSACKHPLKKSSFIGLIFSLLGIVVMLDDVASRHRSSDSDHFSISARPQFGADTHHKCQTL